ncbi:MAG: TlpA family protein disulfide reductase [Gammaproteobacteria bacterium]|nr:TlpA family protein disulfide reductase [Gammaproteobacteria bacterium]
MKTGVLCAVLLCWPLIAASATSRDPSCLVGRPAPDFTLSTVDGQVFTLSDYPGDHQVLLILFWGVWCPFCREIMVRLTEQASDLSERGLAIVAISLRESRAKVSLFADQLRPGFPVLVDEWASLKDSYLIHDVPMALVLDREHIIQAAVITTSVDKVHALIEQALAPDASASSVMATPPPP